MAKKKNQIIEKLEITDAAAEGKAVASVNGKVCFVQYAVPGDVIDVEVYRKKNSYMEGRILAIHQSSPHRITPFCSHFGVCGGCKWQQMAYAQQLFYKEKQVVNALQRIGKVEVEEQLPILGSDDIRYYRNKLEFTFTNRRWFTQDEEMFDENAPLAAGVGFHIPGRFDKVLDIETCYLQDDLSNEIRRKVKQYALEHKLKFYNMRSHVGFLRNLIIRNSTLNEWMVIVVVAENDERKITPMMHFIQTSFPQITSLFYVINDKMNDDISDRDCILFSGQSYMLEQLEDLKFIVGPKSFFQTNTKQALVLYRIVRNFAALTGNEVVYDLYTGTGSIALFVAAKAKKVIGLEYVEQAIENAKANAQLNKIEHADFFAGDMVHVFNDELIATHGLPDVVITDPPRAGMHPDVVSKLLEVAPKRIVYVSCNAATQARDLNMMNHLYRVVKAQPVDMFPHTHHIENVVLLEKR